MTNNINNSQLLNDVTRYWNIRAESYSESNQQELLSEKQQKWRHLLLSHVKEGETLKVLDIGTGPGFFAILLALSGHDVTAIDATQGMLLEAKNNAAHHNANIQFVRGDVHQLPFGHEQFDLVVSRNVTWNLKAPQQAYQEWFRVLKPGGSLINFDANWYLHLFDDAYWQGFLADREQAASQQVSDHYVNTDTKEMERIARQLPLSRIKRPQWDLNTLMDIGFSRYMVDLNIGDLVWDKEEKINYGSTPMFMIHAQKQKTR
ncbi:class I SAM-dependent methyltransferase [Proteus hauseri]|uniref:SmtA family protein n=1 Tax=Proteus hauseri ATCC 700826 TaxID=1354271 RepID=A0AAJ3HVV1_PROHU|nr:class I SAM-dependent methyltransferase [Proteus hauseri]OAT51100.1 SmtA family protein [Proteus hauseri ATCC 700826]QAV22971.1 class I SAM-dependent methyltransferase [Proteus hauseri]